MKKFKRIRRGLVKKAIIGAFRFGRFYERHQDEIIYYLKNPNEFLERIKSLAEKGKTTEGKPKITKTDNQRYKQTTIGFTYNE